MTYSFKDLDQLAKYLEDKGQNMLDSAREEEKRREQGFKAKYSKAVIARHHTAGNTYLSVADMLRHTVLMDQPPVHRTKMELGDLYGGVMF